MRPVPGERRLDILKALGDNTRYAIYLELARSPVPLSTGDVAEVLELHPNTVRPHLERMRDVGLLTVDTVSRGGVGRPQHRYALARDAPALGLEPSPFPALARLLLTAAASAGLDGADVEPAAVAQGESDATRWAARSAVTPGSPGGATCLDALVAEQSQLGFDPAVVDDGTAATMAFTHCPFRELAEIHPELVCALHRGLVRGFVHGFGGAEVERFHSLADRNPCQVEIQIHRPDAIDRPGALVPS